MATEDDDEELTFDTEAPAPKAQPETEKPTEAAAPAAEPKAKAEAPETAATTQAPAPASSEAKEAKTGAKPAEAAPAPSRKPSRSGMAIAACLGLCVITSTVSAVQSWRAASIAAEAGASGSTKDVIAKLNALQTLVERQRDAIDELATRPSLAAAPSPQAIDGQINALAAAVKVNQEIAERLPSEVMKQVDSRLARAEAKRPAPAARTAARPAVQRSVATKRPPERTADAAKVLGTPIVPVVAVTEKKRPAGEAISYP